MKKWFSTKIVLWFFISLVIMPCLAVAQAFDDTVYLDHTKLVAEQVHLLNGRLLQAQGELAKLKRNQALEFSSLSIDKVTKPLDTEVQLKMTIAKSNLDSISIELSESEQTIDRLNKSIHELENQLNLVNIFGVKIVHLSPEGVKQLTGKLKYEKKLLMLENQRINNLSQLQDIANKIVQIYQAKHEYISTLLKSQLIMSLKEEQAKTELAFQQQQADWLQKLSQLNTQLSQVQHAAVPNKSLYTKLEAEIYYVNENVNFSYLQMLIARYQDQIRQLKASVTRGSPISVLHTISEQVQLLSKQLLRVSELLKTRILILDKRVQVFSNQANYNEQLYKLGTQYKSALTSVAESNQELAQLNTLLEQTLQHELSARQGLPGFDTKGWLDLSADIVVLPGLMYHMIKNLAANFMQALAVLNYTKWMLLLVLEFLWLSLLYVFNKILIKMIAPLADHEAGHINLKWLIIKLLHRNLLDLMIIGNIIGFLYFCNLATQSFLFVIHLAIIWLIFKVIIVLARLYLVETVHDRSGIDVRLYHRLRWTFIVGGIITACAVSVHGMPVNYEVKDLFTRLFLLFLLVISFSLLRSWDVLPGLIIPHIDAHRTHLKRVIRWLGVLVPLTLLVNSLFGLFGYVNLVYTIAWYQGMFLIVLIGYLITRGLLIELMEFLSNVLIRYVPNGWLWTEAFLKPIDKVLRIVLFLMAWATLFLVYGWDRQSAVVERLNKLIHYPLGSVFNTLITPLSIIELVVIISLLYWAAKWTREFVYRFFLSGTKDISVRNSIAILSQYAMIVIGVLIGLRVLGVDFTALTVVASAFAFGIGLGLRDLANNFASGFLLLIERPLKVGDVVTINGYEGDVIHIGGRAVTIRTWDHIDVVVPNAEIFSKTFMNWTAKDNIVRSVTTLKIDRHDNPLEVQKLIYAVLDQNIHVLKEPVPEVFCNQLSDGLVEFEIRFYVNLRLIKSRIGIRSEVLIGIWEAFEKHGIKAPYPHREIYLKGS